MENLNVPHDESIPWTCSDSPGWMSDEAFVGLDFVASVGVAAKVFTPLRRVDHGALGNLVWRAKRQWRKWFP